MSTDRLEAFSDGVIAIIITIMVLELKAPRGTDLSSLQPMVPVFLSYLLSFVYVGIYWNNHHHLLQAATKVNGQILWANLHLLFWMSLIPFATAWMGNNDFAAWPLALYGTVLLFAGIAYTLLARSLVDHHGGDSLVATAIAGDWKGKISLILYTAAICLSFISPGIAGALYVVVALMWLIPEPRIEQQLAPSDGSHLEVERSSDIPPQPSER